MAHGGELLELILAGLCQNGSPLSRIPREVGLQRNGIALLQLVITDHPGQLAVLELDTRRPKS
jgi:hypothetical protein